MEEQFVVDNLVIKLMEKKKECITKLYTTYQKRIEAFLRQEKEFASKPLYVYLEEVRRRKAQAAAAAEAAAAAREAAEAAGRSQALGEAEAAAQAAAGEQREAQSRQQDKKKARMEAMEAKRRKSMVVHIDDMSFCFGKEELEQIAGPAKPVDPQVKNVLEQMNELFKQLNKK